MVTVMKITPPGKLLTSLLGAFNGAVYSTVMLLMIWAGMAVSNRDNALKTTPYGDFVQFGTNVRWSSVVIAWLVTFTLASLIVSGLWPKNKKRSILFWEIVGVVAVAAWNGFALLGVWFDYHFSGDTLSYKFVTSLSNPLFGPISLAVIIIVNFFYGYLAGGFYQKLWGPTSEGRPV